MPQRNRSAGKRQKPRRSTQAATLKEAPAVIEKKRPVEYGKPFILMEDASKNTFEFKQGEWVRHAMSIAECRQSCRVKELPQKVKDMTRYEIHSPVPEAL